MPYWAVDEDDNDRASPSVKTVYTPGGRTILGERIGKHASGVPIIPRQLFCEEYWDYKAGEHVTFGGPSKKGKSQLSFDLLRTTATSECPAYVAVSKPTDAVTEVNGKLLDFRFVDRWPPGSKISDLWNGKPKGFVVWPKFGNIATDMDNAATITATLINDRYSASARKRTATKSAGILVMDDTMVKAKVMGLDSQMVTILAMAGGMKLGLWVFVQKPTDSGRTTLWAYENCDHLFLTRGGDQRMLRRYEEIGNLHGNMIWKVVPMLERYQFLYLHDDDICIVDARTEAVTDGYS